MKINPVAIVLILVSLSFASFQAGQAFHARKAYKQAQVKLRDAQSELSKKIQELRTEVQETDRMLMSYQGINPAKHQTFGAWKWFAGDHSPTNGNVLESAWPGANGRWKRIQPRLKR